MGHQVDASARDLGTRAKPTSPVVLVCDDETRLATLTAELLEGFGFQSIAVASGQAALDTIQAGAPEVSVMLLDVHLSLAGSALEILEHLTRTGSRVPVVLISGQPRLDAPLELTTHPNVTRYLEKPYSAEALLGAVKHALNPDQ